jgi:hypothetical protein
MNKIQRENLGKFFVDIAKLLMAVVVFVSFPHELPRFFLGLVFVVVFLILGLKILERTNE